MQVIRLKKFGNLLISRPSGLESFIAIRPSIDKDKPVSIDFDEVLTVTPAWFDEFLTQLSDYVAADITLLPTENASVKAVLPVLAITRDDKVAKIVQKYLDAN